MIFKRKENEKGISQSNTLSKQETITINELKEYREKLIQIDTNDNKSIDNNI